ncbi:hypothetical protein ACFSTC_40875 [Nonomuraea ferruginea]
MTQTGAEPILEAVGLEVGYGHLPVLKGLSVAVRPGEIVALLGANGAKQDHDPHGPVRSPDTDLRLGPARRLSPRRRGCIAGPTPAWR